MKSPRTGFSLIELTVSLAIGSFLIAGAVTVYARSRATYTSNETLARIQENALYALSTIEADVRMAGFWGLTNDSRFISGTLKNAPLAISGGGAKCGAEFPIDLQRPIAGDNGAYSLPCPPGPSGSAIQPNSDTLFVRHADIPVVSATDDRLQIYTTRQGTGAVFRSDTAPAPIAVDALTGPTAEVHDLIARAYYISRDSSYQAGLPSLRRKNLQGGPSSGPTIEDQEILPGVEDLQLRFHIHSGAVEPDDPRLLTEKVLGVSVEITVRAETAVPGDPNRLSLSRTFAVLN